VEAPLTILYTHRLRGDLALLPRLYTFIGRLKAEHAEGGRALLLDLGESCAAEVFPCALTGGRSTLIALDAMGYDAANVRGALAQEDRARLDAMFLNIALIDEAHRLEKPGLVVGHAAGGANGALYVEVDPAELTTLANSRLRLAGIDGGQVGMVRLGSDEAGGWRLAAEGVFTMPPDVRPTPTISGMIDMILSEARYTQKRRGR
jgi:hypothetical protein